MSSSAPDDTTAIPESVKGLIPDAIESDEVSPRAQKIVDSIANEASSIKEWTEQKIEEGKSLPTAKVALNGIFKHPSEFTEEEWEIIIKGLKAHLPLGRIATAVHCERHFLGKKIAEMKEVAQVALDAKESYVDEAQYQLHKIANSGSLAAAIFILQHWGADRGWGDGEQTKNPDAEETHINLGLISPEQLEEAQRRIAEAQKQTTPTLATQMAALEEGIMPPAATPQELAMAEDIKRQAEASLSAPAAPQQAQVSSYGQPPYDASQQQPATQQGTPSNFGGQSYEYLESMFNEEGGGSDGEFGGGGEW